MNTECFKTDPGHSSWIEIPFFNIFGQKYFGQKYFKFSLQYLENKSLNGLKLIVDMIYGLKYHFSTYVDKHIEKINVHCNTLKMNH